jgi:hypothetical protein
MAKFMLLYISPISAEEQMASATPEQMEAGMQAWMAWFGKLGPALVDGGTPFGQGTNVSKDGSSGSSTTQLGGYSVIEAQDVSAAKALLNEHPHFMVPGASIEIREMLPMPGM